MKKIARIFASSILKTTLFSAAITAGIIGIIGSPDGLKQPLNDSKVYDTLLTSALEKANEETASDASSSQDGIDLTSPQIKQAAEAALTPETLQNSTEGVIDGIYRWLNGEVSLPDFRIDLTEPKQRFITAAGQQAEAHTASLPICTNQELQALAPDADPFSQTCRPANLSPAAARQNLEAKLNSGEFLKDPVLTPETLAKDEDTGKTVFEDAQGTPDAFQKLKSAPFFLLGLSFLLGLAVFFLSDSYRRGVRNLAVTLLGTGVFVLVTAWLGSVIFNGLIKPEGAIGKSIENELQTSVLAVLRALSSAFSSKVLVYAVAYILIGGGALLALKLLWKKPGAETIAAPPVIAKTPTTKKTVTK